MFKKIVAITSTLALFGLVAFGTAHAAVSTAPGQNKILCFDGTTDGGYNGTCTLLSNGAKGPAKLDTADGDSDPYNNYAGVYTETSNMYGAALADVGQLSFSYSGDAATAGSPRFSIPISTDSNAATTEQWLYASAYYCNDGAGYVDVINDPTCTLYTSGSESFDNWAALVAAHPDWTIATDNYVFLIADDPGTWTVSGVTIGKPGK